MNPWFVILPVSFVLGIVAGWTMRADHEDAARLAQFSAAIQQGEQRKHDVDQLAVAQSAVNAAQATKDRVITREVIRYVQVTPAADRCVLPATWRVQHDAAASGEPAASTGLASAAAGPVTDDTALVVVAENYTSCREYIRQLEGWQAWCVMAGICHE
jgi:hypothetical protein